MAISGNMAIIAKFIFFAWSTRKESGSFSSQGRSNNITGLKRRSVPHQVYRMLSGL